MTQSSQSSQKRAIGYLPGVAVLLLSACGGGGSDSGTSTASGLSEAGTAAQALTAGGTTTLQLDVATLPEAAAMLEAQPAFHAAPLLLDSPDDTDVADPSASATRPARAQTVPASSEGLSTRRMTAQTLETVQASQRLQRLATDGTAKPLAAASVVSTYSPAQIRAAYGLPALPAAGATLSAAQAAQLGAGQTIYIVDAMHDPSVAAELEVFNQKFGLPLCTSKAVAATASLPLAKASASVCELSVVYSTAVGAMSSKAPAYDAGWATEITLDVQWAHATAPLARIVLIEAPDASLNSLLGAVKLANAMGPGVVSMSFGGNEGTYTASVDAAFAVAGMTYLAATGDSGAGVSWPAVSPKVLAVGGTSLSYSGSGARAEVAWSGTGGGISAYTPTPSYQSAGVPGVGSLARRGVADVAFNANPSTGQYVAVLTPGSSTVKWLSVGGTSLSTPQWAGVVAVANAVRAQSAKAALGAPHAVLYGQIGAVPGTYASAFADVSQGTHGTCTTCAAKAGYDELTGLGTPNVAALLTTLAGAGVTAATPVAATDGGTGAISTKAGPVITAAAITGVAGKPLSGTISVSAPGATSLSISISGVPQGMTFSASGMSFTAAWASPVAGSYSLKVVAVDSAGNTATATVPITVNAK